ncbi:MAG: YtxH domain-containing protein [Patescibacteria group bacterium]
MKKTNKKSSKFLSGALIGTALGVAAGIFSASKTGKEMRKEMKDKSIEFYEFIAPQIKKAKEMGEKEYKIFINRALVNYNKNKKFKKEDLKNLAKEAHASWKHLKKHL